jgi:hypothetical protein
MNALAGGMVGSFATALVTFLLKDFFLTTKKDLQDLTKAVVSLTYECKTLQRDLLKVEAVIENQQIQLSASIKETATLLANIKALWTALERIHPVCLPGRMSDRGGHSGDQDNG